MSSSESSSKPAVVAVCQMTATDDVGVNLSICQKLINKSKKLGASMTFLPECFDFVGSSSSASWELSSTMEKSEFLSAIRSTAKANGIWVSLGGMHRRPSPSAGNEDAPLRKVFNSHIIIDCSGEIRSIYDKLHLFSVNIEGGPRLDENSFSIPGSRLTPPLANTPAGVLGLQICYDLRFPEASLALTRAGAEVLTYPSAFTKATGEAHWESLLRARAIENQCFVVAAAQVGQHNAKRFSHGHAMIIDPWGKVLADCGGVRDCRDDNDDDDNEDICGVVKVASIDLERLRKVRREMPIWNHRRKDVYGQIQAKFRGEEEKNDETRTDISEAEGEISKDSSANNEGNREFRFGADVVLSAGVVFAETPLSFAFVNRKPVLPGHVLVAPKRLVSRMKEMSAAEVSDLFLLSQRVSSVVESHFAATACTLCVQDGPNAGQTVAHVHAHVLPRRSGDFERNDDIYEELANHDKGEEAGKGWRTKEVMEKEAKDLRLLF